MEHQSHTTKCRRRAWLGIVSAMFVICSNLVVHAQIEGHAGDTPNPYVTRQPVGVARTSNSAASGLSARCSQDALQTCHEENRRSAATPRIIRPGRFFPKVKPRKSIIGYVVLILIVACVTILFTMAGDWPTAILIVVITIGAVYTLRFYYRRLCIC